MNILKVIQQFKTQEDCIAHLEKVRWNNIPTCPYCKSQKSSKFKNTRYYTCLNKNCGNGYSVTVKTIFHDTKVPLQKWFIAISLVLNAKKGISGPQLQRDLGLGSYKTAFRILKLIRKSMVDKQTAEYFYTIVEMDETYVGGKPRKFSGKRGRGTYKTPVIGIVNRETKQVYAKVATPNEDGRKLTGKQLLSVLNEVTKEYFTTVMTDEFRSYNILKKTNYTHFVVDHTKEYVNENVHTNSIESFWATLKRGLYGIYHNVSKKYLQQYINEFCFRYNNRDVSIAFDSIMNNAVLIKNS